jgi:CBS domain containing-hemolysin-like protein
VSDVVGIVWLVVLIVVNAFFVGAEFAVISARRSQIEPLAERGRRSAKTALWAMEHATLMLATTQLGITVCSLLILNVSEPAIHHLLALGLGLTGLPVEAITAISFVVALILVSFLHVVFGEMVPKNLSFSMPDRAALLLAPALVAVARALKPIIVVLNATANGVVRVFRVQPRGEAVSTYTLDEVATIVDQSTREGVLNDRSGALTAAFEFTEKKAQDIALELGSLICLPVTVTPAKLEKAVSRHGFSRYVLVDSAGEPAGYLHVKDVLDLDETAYAVTVPRSRIRPLITIAGETDLEDALASMRSSGVHLARVADANGRTLGILFLEDIIELLVGEVHDATRRSRP